MRTASCHAGHLCHCPIVTHVQVVMLEGLVGVKEVKQFMSRTGNNNGMKIQS